MLSHFASVQARAIVRAIEIEIAGASDVLATKQDVVTLEHEIAKLRTSMAEWRGELRAEMHALASSGVRQMYMALLGQMAVLLGFAYFFATRPLTPSPSRTVPRFGARCPARRAQGRLRDKT